MVENYNNTYIFANDMTEQELQQYLIKQYPKEDEGCEWKEFKNLKNDFSGHENKQGFFTF